MKSASMASKRRHFHDLVTGFLLATLLCGMCDSAFSASFCRSLGMRAAYVLQGFALKFVKPGRIYTGYHSGGIPEVVWSPELVAEMTRSEGIYAPGVRTYARENAVSLAEAVKVFEGFRQAPEEVQRFLVIAHKWESLSYLSPFISSATSKSVAAGFGPFGIYLGNVNVGQSVLFQIKADDLPAPRYGIMNYRRAYEVILTALKDGDLRPGDRDYPRVGVVQAWMAQNPWLAKVVQKGATANMPSWPDVATMAALEREVLTWGHIPASSIDSAILFDAEGQVIEKF